MGESTALATHVTHRVARGDPGERAITVLNSNLADPEHLVHISYLLTSGSSPSVYNPCMRAHPDAGIPGAVRNGVFTR